jgi:hypothetical protein
MPSPTKSNAPYTPERCPCGHKVCKDWHVWPVAAIQGVSFTKAQATAVAELLNAMEARNAPKST